MIPNSSLDQSFKQSMNNNDNSLMSDNSTPYKGTNLDDQLQNIDSFVPNDWKNDSFDLNVSNPLLDLQQCRDQFNSLSKQQLQSQTIKQQKKLLQNSANDQENKENIQLSEQKYAQNEKQILQSIRSSNQQANANLNRDTQLKQTENVEEDKLQLNLGQKIESQASQSPAESIATVTLVGQTMISHSQTGNTGGNSTMSSHGQGSNFKQFLYVNQNTYQPHIAAVTSLYRNVKEYSQRSSENLRMYYLFFKTKLQQEKAYFDEKSIEHKIQNNQLHNFVYVNAKMALNQLADSRQNEIDRGKKFLEVLKFCFHNVENLLKQVQKNRYEQQTQFELHSKILAGINYEIDRVLQSRLQKQGISQRDRYSESKFVIKKQKIYLNGIYEMNRKIIKYINTCLSEQEIYIWSTVKSALTQYCKAYKDCYPGEKRFMDKYEKLLSVENDKQLVDDLVDILQRSLPKSLLPELKSNEEGKNKLQQILIALNKQFEQTIYFPIIQIQDGLVIYRSSGFWTAAGKKKEEVEILVSVDGFLHFEKQSDLEILNLKGLKIAQKGNQIILSEKNRGVVQFLMKKPQLGKIEFDDKEEKENFIRVVLTFLKKI